MRVQRAEALSVTDDLTGLYNSRYLAQVLRREAKRASRSGRPLSLLFGDLDGFKAINDTHGHLFGSRALVEAAGDHPRHRARNRRRRAVRRRRVCVGPAGYRQRRRRRRRAPVSVSGWPRTRFLQGDGLSIASDGVGRGRDAARRGGLCRSLIQAADKAMYRVKEHGKNGIFVAGSEISE